MAVLLTKDTRVVVQGITGHQGQFHTRAMLDFGTKVVAGTSPGKAGEQVHGVPVFDTVADAVQRTRANCSLILVPAPFTKDAVMEALDAGVRAVIVITEHVPFHDALDFVHYARYKQAVLVGPNCPGACSPGEKSKVGILPGHIFQPGPVAIASRSGTLTYEIVDALTHAGLGQSTCIGLGGDPIPGTTFIDALAMFEKDAQTRAVVLVGEIGGTAEEEAAAYIKENLSKPVFAYIAGRTAPPGKRMGHAGAIIARGMGTAESKMKAFEAAKCEVARFPTDVAQMVRKVL
jgi:succinyl-CoA synthetase alpha subunit